ncbi:MAG TPA: c-type cytochrome [Thermoanaerobaculia bacterium]
MKRLALFALFAVACNRTEPVQPVQKAAPPAMAATGNATRGQEMIAQYGCNVCHIVPGINGPQGSLGPSLAGIASRPTISAANVPNTQANLVQFIQNPGSLNPQSSMPPIALAPEDAKDIVAYLQTLK